MFKLYSEGSNLANLNNIHGKSYREIQITIPAIFQCCGGFEWTYK